MTTTTLPIVPTTLEMMQGEAEHNAYMQYDPDDTEAWPVVGSFTFLALTVTYNMDKGTHTQSINGASVYRDDARKYLSEAQGGL